MSEMYIIRKQIAHSEGSWNGEKDDLLSLPRVGVKLGGYDIPPLL